MTKSVQLVLALIYLHIQLQVDILQAATQSSLNWSRNGLLHYRPAICPAENPNDISYEKPHQPLSSSSSSSSSSKAEDYNDDDDTAGDPVEDDDNDDDNDNAEDDDNDDESLQCSANANRGNEEDDAEAFMARITCLLRELHGHSRAIQEDLRELDSQLGPPQPAKSKPSCQNKPSPGFKLNHITSKFHNLNKVKLPNAKKPEKLGQAYAQNENYSTLDNHAARLTLADANSKKYSIHNNHLSVDSAEADPSKKDQHQSAMPANNEEQQRKSYQHVIKQLRLAKAIHAAAAARRQRSQTQKSTIKQGFRQYEANLKQLVANRDLIEQQAVQMLTHIRQ
ncbi:rRNA biogenesis protein rrp36 [Drosophila willistoni]|uniref:rRNA biogenesis protein rrp36 n=1 Tax=Drosophila willistoni TaxID=7260 RepID=UPI00017D8CFC|nr:rRNA biogenesis protein rrp36 [Drosophila willistoni]